MVYLLYTIPPGISIRISQASQKSNIFVKHKKINRIYLLLLVSNMFLEEPFYQRIK